MASPRLLQHLKDEISRLVGLSLTKTTPLYIGSSDTALKEDVDGYAIEALDQDVTFTTLNIKGWHKDSTSGGDFSSITLPAGKTLYVNVKDIQLDGAGGGVVVHTEKR